LEYLARDAASLFGIAFLASCQAAQKRPHRLSVTQRYAKYLSKASSVIIEEISTIGYEEDIFFIAAIAGDCLFTKRGGRAIQYGLER
jgi:hypothetical protein